MPEHPEPLDTWAIVEVMGHKQFAGHVTEQLFGSAALIRVDVPATEQPAAGWQDSTSPLPPRTTNAYSKLVGVGSIYCITPCTEEVARAAATRLERYNNPIPVALPRKRPRSSVRDLARTERIMGDPRLRLAASGISAEMAHGVGISRDVYLGGWTGGFVRIRRADWKAFGELLLRLDGERDADGLPKAADL